MIQTNKKSFVPSYNLQVVDSSEIYKISPGSYDVKRPSRSEQPSDTDVNRILYAEKKGNMALRKPGDTTEEGKGSRR